MKSILLKYRSQNLNRVLISIGLLIKTYFSFGQGVVVSNNSYPVCVSFSVSSMKIQCNAADNNTIHKKSSIEEARKNPFDKLQETKNRPTPCDSDRIVVVYPNPSQSDFRLQVLSCKDKKLTIQIFDVMGKLISIVYGKTNQTMRIGGQLKSGIYFAEIITGNNKNSITLKKINK